MPETTRTPTRAVARQARTRAALIRAAGELLAERGLEGLRVNDVTDRANVAFGTFYNQFKAKDDIVDAVITEALVRLTRSVEDSPEFEDPEEAVVASAMTILRIAYDDPNLARILVNLEQAVSRFEQVVRLQAEATLQRGVESGAFQIADMTTVLTMAIGAVFEVIRGVAEGQLGEGADLTCAEIVLRMVGVDAARAAERVAAVHARGT